ncbi:unnamed protein product [Aspergillus oryzae]|uniref:Unnamed protein product n=2 Tax=Aspergillus oryzae TaxID=5062 RepID=A0AAN5C2G9_ASPOZ|nr:unnamed protein product [Aspergillus oryzae]GMF93105.1 unnamed protein product [Aspergillus oryzae]GMG36510.1 unnamed protein product [Aspergillus oryzae]GMG47025.1 unnamed protein product [Aspergillus oryzae var. brunneus]
MENSAAEQRLSVFDVDVTEPTVRSLADDIRQTHPKAPLRLALTVPGILHVEKSPSQIDAHAALESLKVNTIGPMLLMKHLTPFLPTRSSPLFDPFDGEVKLPQHAIYAMMAARVGSVSDNRMGGWYSYRASKAAVFQLAKTLDLYLEGKCADRAISLAMHPGTVKTDFTKSYQDGREMLSAEESAERLCGVLVSTNSAWYWERAFPGGLPSLAAAPISSSTSKPSSISPAISTMTVSSAPCRSRSPRSHRRRSIMRSATKGMHSEFSAPEIMSLGWRHNTRVHPAVSGNAEAEAHTGLFG